MRAFAVLAAVAFLTALAVPSQAGHTFSAQGLAVSGTEVLRASIGGQLQRFDGPGIVGLGVILFRNAPTPEDAFQIEVVEEAYFLGVTNFIDGQEFGGPLAVQHNFLVESTTPGITFRLSGVRLAQSFVAEGQFQDYALLLSPIEV